MELISNMARANKQTIVMVTHDNSLANYADRIIRISDGKVLSIEETGNNKESDKKEGQITNEDNRQ